MNYSHHLTALAPYLATPSPNIPHYDSDGTESGRVKVASDLQNQRSSRTVPPLLNFGTDASRKLNRLERESTENQSESRVEYNMGIHNYSLSRI